MKVASYALTSHPDQSQREAPVDCLGPAKCHSQWPLAAQLSPCLLVLDLLVCLFLPEVQAMSLCLVLDLHLGIAGPTLAETLQFADRLEHLTDFGLASYQS